MKHKGVVTGLFAAVLLTAAGAAWSQVEVEMVMNQGQFLIGETMPVAVRVVNHSGQTLHFGQEDWLDFTVEGAGRFVVPRTGDPTVGHNFDLATGKVATQHADLAPLYTFSKTGHFTVTATVKLADWGAEASSSAKGFDVIQGVKLWEQEFGVPDASGTNSGPPEVRKYVLQKATYLEHLRLYLRVTDETGSRTIKVFAVGPIVSFGEQQTRLDRQNHLHLLYVSGGRLSCYAEVNPDGDLLKRQSYDYVDNDPPRLVSSESGEVKVAGGHRHVMQDDVPPAGTPSIPTVPVVDPPPVKH